MAIVLISSMFQEERQELAHALQRKTGWPVLSREELIDEARDVGIKMGRLEMSMIKAPGRNEKLAREKELYLAFLTARLSEKAIQGDLIYHGRAGHLLLPGISHRLRVGVTAPWEARIRSTARALRLPPDKANAYLTQLDEDVSRWIRYVHQVDGSDPRYFDVFVNLENMGLSNVAGVLCSMAELPDFQPTPAGERLLQDHFLAAQAKLRLASDERTKEGDFRVKADRGVITVTYPPLQQQFSAHIVPVLTDLEGCKKILCTMAESNILWVQERFDPQSENFKQIIQLAQRWGAAVELLRLTSSEEIQGALEASAESNENNFKTLSCPINDGGVEDDEPGPLSEDGGLHRTHEALVNLGRSAGQRTVCGGYEKILESVQGNGRYTLVVVGEMFISKGVAARTRLTRELALNLRDRLKAPVITADELKSRFLFGKRQAVALLGFLAMLVAVYMLVFMNQEKLIDFLSGSFHQHFKWLSAVGVALFVPCIAYAYGKVTGLALKIINID